MIYKLRSTKTCHKAPWSPNRRVFNSRLKSPTVTLDFRCDDLLQKSKVQSFFIVTALKTQLQVARVFELCTRQCTLSESDSQFCPVMSSLYVLCGQVSITANKRGDIADISDLNRVWQTRQSKLVLVQTPLTAAESISRSHASHLTLLARSEGKRHFRTFSCLI